MVRKLTHKTQVLRGIAPVIAVLTALVALAALAQMANVGQPSVPPAFVPTRQEANTWQHRPLTDAVGVGRVAVSRLQEKRFGVVAADTQAPLFLPGVPYYSGGFYAMSVAIADVNGDGKLDALVATSPCYYRGNCGGPGSVGVLLGNGDGTLQTAVTYPSGGNGLVSAAVADVNGDGKPDLIVVNSCATDNCTRSSVGVLLGNGDGTFQAAVTYDSGGSYASSVAVADVNGDGKPDLLVAHWGNVGNGSFPNGTVGVLLGNGDGTFQAAVTYDSGGVFPSVAVADVNGDGKPDLVVANSCVSGCDYPGPSTVGVLLGNGDGTFQGATVYGSGGYYGGFIQVSIAIADVNGDGKPDLVVTNECTAPNNCVSGSVGVLLGNGDGSFQPAVAYDSGGVGADSVAVADVNGDGRADLLVANYCTSLGNGNCSNVEGAVGVLLGNGDGTFQPALTYDSGGAIAISLAVGDMNGDGRRDLVVANLSGDSVGVMLNDTGPHTSTTTTLVSNRNPATIVQIVTYTATVTSQSRGITGTVTFYDGSATIATVPPVNNQAAYSTKYKTIGAHTITAAYSGDLHNTGSTSASVTEYIEYPSKTVLTTSGSPSLVGQPVTFTATVMSTYGRIPDGEMVTFFDGSAALGSVALAGGTAAYTTSALSGKTHRIKATYAGDATFASSTGWVMQVVDQYPTTTALSSSSNPSAYGQAVAFTATVTGAGPSPSGKVWFKDGTTGIGMVSLNSGVATLTKSKLAVGTHPITAQYLGDATSAKSTSSVLNQVVQ
jgi:hypothetical protein